MSARGNGGRSFSPLTRPASFPCCRWRGRRRCAAFTPSPNTWPRGRRPPLPRATRSKSFPLLPGDRAQRAETRRLIDWFNGKFNREVTHELLQEKVYARLQPAAAATPDVDFLRAIRNNLRYHMSYISYLADRRRWLAGEDLSFADLAAAAHLSSVDYLGEVPWEEYAAAKVWYARLKSRRAFRTLLADRVAGVQPAAHYANLDF